MYNMYKKFISSLTATLFIFLTVIDQRQLQPNFNIYFGGRESKSTHRYIQNLQKTAVVTVFIADSMDNRLVVQGIYNTCIKLK